MILLHAFGGLVALLCLIWFCLRRLRETSWMARLGWIALTAGGLIGGALVRMGTTRQNAKWLFLHIGLCMAGVVLLAANQLAQWLSARTKMNPIALRIAGTIVLAISACGLAYGSWAMREGLGLARHVTNNPSIAPARINPEYDGPKSPVFPSSGQAINSTYTPHTILSL